jgi:hypothetical protein
MAKLLERSQWVKNRARRKGKKILKFRLRQTETDIKTLATEDIWQMLEIRSQL